MKNKLLAPSLPKQNEGNQSNTEHKITCSSEEDAKNIFAKVLVRMVDVNHWHNFGGKATAAFQLYDEKGNPVSRAVQEKDFFEIDVPGPGPKTGGGNDWVHVEKISSMDLPNGQLAFITVRPSPKPNASPEISAHFFSSSATSTFAVVRMGRDIIAGVYGRNEMPNVHPANLFDKIRNIFIALGAMVGLSNVQWKALIRGWLDLRR